MRNDYSIRPRAKLMKGGKAKKKKGFPDLNKDGKVTLPSPVKSGNALPPFLSACLGLIL